MSYEKLVLVGYVGKPAELRFAPTGKAVCSFSVAVNKQFTRQDGETVKQTKWFTVTTWGALAENCNRFVTKGMQVLVEGELTADEATGGPRAWSRKDGTPGANFEMVAANVRFLSSSQPRQDGGGDQDDFSGEKPDIPF